MKAKTVRCAIYTRKSTEHNLDLEFNSLHAQREACEAYIKSQMHEGWQLIPDSYDDGGISGASLERPDLQRLLGDIAAGKVDNVVVYKVDRLTRSLMDFARLVELFDKHGVSFVSVTQSFNTTSSMGRLTLNVLLSFAQFEREVIGERVRDKIAASKKKGLFMGGNIPLGYINRNKKLVIVPQEAEQVRWLFRRYLELGSLGRLLEEMDRLNIRTKTQTLSTGRKRGGVRYGKGALAYLLKNRCYVGEILHQGQVHPAEHDPIIDRGTFEAVQASFLANTVAREERSKASCALLTGLLFDSAGNRMTPSHSRKKGVIYRYYVSQAVLQSRKGEAGLVDRVPAPEIEALVEQAVRERFRGSHADLRTLVESQIARVNVEDGSVAIELRAPSSGEAPPPIRLPWSKAPFRAVKGVIGAPSRSRSQAQQEDPRGRDALLAAIAKARRWIEELTNGTSLEDIATREGCTPRHIRLTAQLAFVSPRIVETIATDTGPPVTATRLVQALPLSWGEQERLYVLETP